MKKYNFLIGLLMLLALVSCTAGAPEGTPPLDGYDESVPVTETLAPTASSQQADQDESSVEPSTEALPEELAIVQERAVARCRQLVEAFNQKTLENPGWLRIVTERVAFENSTQEDGDSTLTEEWYRLNADGYIIEGYAWTLDSEGEFQQESVYLNGLYDGEHRNNWYNLEYDFGAEGDIQRPHEINNEPLVILDGGFCNQMEGFGSANLSAVIFESHPAIQFSYVHQVDALFDGDPLIESLYFDQDSFWPLGLDRYWVQQNGNLKIVQGLVYPIIEFNADPPEDRFAEIWARVPHGDTFVPVEQGEP
jgi:hypothetical protein